MNQNEQGTMVAPTKENIIRVFKEYFAFKIEAGITYEILQENQNKELDINPFLTKEDKDLRKKQNFDIYKKTEANLLRMEIVKLLQFDLARGNILFENVFAAAKELTEDCNKELSIQMSLEDQMGIYFQVLQGTLQQMNFEDQVEFGVKELKMLNDKKEKAIKANRAFGRPTPITDTIEEV